MSQSSSKITNAKLADNTLSIYWLAQAGFGFKTKSGTRVYIDPYFSDAVERKFGFKRQMVCPISASEVIADLYVCTHEHLDHMDTDALPIIAGRNHTHFAGPIECYKHFREVGISADRCHLLEEGKAFSLGDVEVKGVFADHGKLSPDALGIVFDFDGIKVYHTGDTAYRPKEFESVIAMRPDVLLPCINGKYGNMNAYEAALLTKSIVPQLVIPTHFGMFVEHNGDPRLFLEQCTSLVPAVKVELLTPGEEYVFSKVVQSRTYTP